MKTLREIVKDQLEVNSEKEFLEILDDVRRGGGDAGWNGFTYYNDVRDFVRGNKRLIMDSLDHDARDYCQAGAMDFVQGFPCLEEYSEDQIADVLYGSGNGDSAGMVYSAIAWYALEKVAFESEGETEGEEKEEKT